jgi:hypothetical protein
LAAVIVSPQAHELQRLCFRDFRSGSVDRRPASTVSVRNSRRLHPLIEQLLQCHSDFRLPLPWYVLDQGLHRALNQPQNRIGVGTARASHADRVRQYAGWIGARRIRLSTAGNERSAWRQIVGQSGGDASADGRGASHRSVRLALPMTIRIVTAVLTRCGNRSPYRRRHSTSVPSSKRLAVTARWERMTGREH